MKTGSRPYLYTTKRVQRFAHYSATAGAPGDVRGLLAAMRRFLEHRAVLGAGERSLVQLERYCRDFIDWCEARGISHPQQVSRQVLERYQRFLHHARKKNGEPLSIVSQKSALAPVRGLFKWLTRQGEIPANPAADLDAPRQVHRLPRAILTAQEAEQVLALPQLSTLMGLRDRAIMELLYATGMRRMEIAQLCCDDIDWERKLVLVRQGKGRKDRLIPAGERALHWAQRYLEEVRPRLAWNANVKAFFLGQEGHALSLERLGSRVAAYVREAKLGKVGGCHLWRHTMATLMLEGGAELRYIQAMLGHTDLATTQIYTHVAVGQLARVHASSHPGVALRRRGEGSEPAQAAVSAAPTALHPTPPPIEEDTPEALWRALAHEAFEEAQEMRR